MVNINFNCAYEHSVFRNSSLMKVHSMSAYTWPPFWPVSLYFSFPVDGVSEFCVFVNSC